MRQLQVEQSQLHHSASMAPSPTVPQSEMVTPSTAVPPHSLLMASFETRSSYFPEEYTLQRRQVQALFMSDNPRGLSFKVGQSYKLCLIHAETPRRWRRITISLVQRPPEGQALKKLINDVLGLGIEFFDTVTNIKIPPDIDATDISATSQLTITEDTEEAKHQLPRHFVAEVDDYGCQQYLESEIVTISAISTNSFNVLVNGKACIEKKLPFALVADNTLSLYYGGFFANITALQSLKPSPAVVNLVGVVLDNSRQQVKSYLYDGAEFGTIGNILHSFNKIGAVVPWKVREHWARSLVSGLAAIHSQGFVVGRLGLWNVVVDRENSLRRKNVDRNVCLASKGWAAPELRTKNHAWERNEMTTKTDLFQLGLELWLLAQHDSGYRMSVSKLACQSVQCTFDWSVHEASGSGKSLRCPETHADPVLLSWSGLDIPAYYQEIVNICRSKSGRDRLPAWQLLQRFPNHVDQSRIEDVPFLGELSWPMASPTEMIISQRETTWWRPRGVWV